ncbi:MAG: CHASE2 domain-containing protein [Rhodocyclaceae bacterium]
MQAPRWRNGGVLALILVCVTALGAINGLGRADRLLTDWFMVLGERPVRDDIVIVGIDDRSLAQLGRWPWRRGVHAELLERLRQAGPRAVGLDIILSEPDLRHPEDDLALADAIAASGNVVLPMRMERFANGDPGPALPVPPLSSAARAIGHIHIDLDRDGIARSVFLREGTDGQWWPHFAQAMLDAAGMSAAPRSSPGIRHPDVLAGRPTPAGLWSRDEGMPIPYAGPPGHFRYVSYVDVLNGDAPADMLRGKLVLVGAQAVGMGDAYPTPMASRDGLMPGVEISANILAGLIDGTTLRSASRWQNALFTLLPVLLAMLALRRLRSRQAAGALVALIVMTLVCAYLAQRYALVQFSPAAALACLILAYPVWSWRRLEAATRYLAEEFQRMEAEGGARLSGTNSNTRRDALGQRIDALSRASAQLRALQRFTRQSIDGMTDPLLVSDESGRVRMANRIAQTYFARYGVAVQGESLNFVLTRRLLLPPETLRALSASNPHEPVAFDVPVEELDGRACLVKGAPRVGEGGAFGGWIVTVVDVSTLEQAQREREEALRFMTHDMRSPQSSIISLVDLRRAGHMDETQTLERIEQHAQRTLSLADGFVNLARARSSDYVLDLIDLRGVMLDAADQLWDRAEARRARIDTAIPDDDCPIDGDGALITRALANIIDNAIKYGPEGGIVRCAMHRDDANVVISVADQGAGIDKADLPYIFNLFGRAGDVGAADGFGLGLSFAHAVLSRHAATIEVRSQPGVGTEFILRFPLSA